MASSPDEQNTLAAKQEVADFIKRWSGFTSQINRFFQEAQHLRFSVITLENKRKVLDAKVKAAEFAVEDASHEAQVKIQDLNKGHATLMSRVQELEFRNKALMEQVNGAERLKQEATRAIEEAKQVVAVTKAEQDAPPAPKKRGRPKKKKD